MADETAVAAHRDHLEARLLDLMAERAYLELQLARAEADGELISIRAVRQALQPEPPEGGHLVVFPDVPKFLLRHPEGCDPASCEVAVSAQRTLKLDRYNPGVLVAWVGADGWLCTRDVTP
jgi:hypothetical protein